MNRIFVKLFDIREGEGVRASLMFAYIFFIITSIMILKPVRSSLFLVSIGIEKLPLVYMLVAIIAAAGDFLHSRVRGGARLNYQIYVTLFLSIASLLVFRVFIHVGLMKGGMLYVFYVWVSIFSVFSATQFWLLANYIFNAREAKRLFGFIGAGAISGGIFGGYVTNYLAPRLRTENLVFICIGLLFICIFLLWQVWHRSRDGLREGLSRQGVRGMSSSSKNPVKLILNSKHLVIMAGLVGIGVIVAKFADYQFSAVARLIISEKDELTAFFGFWMSNINIASLVVQLFVTGTVIKRSGVPASLFFLPTGLLVGSLAVLVSPRLSSAVMVKFGDGALKHSINKAGSELLALPIPPSIKTEAKTFIDIVVDNMATGLAGLLLILLAFVPGFSVRYISIASIVFLAFWFYLILKVKSEYVNSFRLAIQKRTINPDEQTVNVEDASLFESLIGMLEGANDRQILYVLNLIEGVHNEKLIPYLERLIRHPSPQVRSAALRMAMQYEELDMSAEARELIESEDQAVKVDAIEYLFRRSGEGLSTLQTFLEHGNYLVRGAAVACATRVWKSDREFRKEIDIKDLLDSMFNELGQPESSERKRHFIKVNAARIIGIAGNPELCPYLDRLLTDESLEVVREAVVSAGYIRVPECVPLLVRHLGTKHIRTYAREALARYGEGIIDSLAAYLENPLEDERIRLAVPRVLAMINVQRSVDVLEGKLDEPNFRLLYEFIRALNKLRTHFPDLRFDRSYIEKRTLEETRQYYRILTLLHRQKNPDYGTAAGGGGDGGAAGAAGRGGDRGAAGTADGGGDGGAADAAAGATGADGEAGDGITTAHAAGETRVDQARRLLMKALEERLDYNLEIIFRFLGLRYRPRDMYDAYLGIVSDRTNLRANAIEFLDNILTPDLKRFIIPIVEPAPPEYLIELIRERFGYEVPSEDESIDILLEGTDTWLKVCAIFLAASIGHRKSVEKVKRLAGDREAIVRETARYYLDRIGEPVPPGL
ncbi:MAG: HEAT repeat domain-containing protein [bacterium]|nr:MAG: HEAT repeat domain-containing protein [bacterium]